MPNKKSSLIEENKVDFMSVEKFKKISQSEPKSTTIEYSSLRELVMFFDKLNPKEVVVMMGDDTLLLIKPLKSDSGIAVSNIR